MSGHRLTIGRFRDGRFTGVFWPSGSPNLNPVAGTRSGMSIIYSLYDDHVAMLLDHAVYHIEHLRLGIADAPGQTAVSSVSWTVVEDPGLVLAAGQLGTHRRRDQQVTGSCCRAHYRYTVGSDRVVFSRPVARLRCLLCGPGSDDQGGGGVGPPPAGGRR